MAESGCHRAGLVLGLNYHGRHGFATGPRSTASIRRFLWHLEGSACRAVQAFRQTAAAVEEAGRSGMDDRFIDKNPKGWNSIYR